MRRHLQKISNNRNSGKWIFIIRGNNPLSCTVVVTVHHGTLGLYNRSKNKKQQESIARGGMKTFLIPNENEQSCGRRSHCFEWKLLNLTSSKIKPKLHWFCPFQRKLPFIKGYKWLLIADRTLSSKLAHWDISCVWMDLLESWIWAYIYSIRITI